MEFLGLKKVYDENYSFSCYCMGLAALMVLISRPASVSLQLPACRLTCVQQPEDFLIRFPASGRPWRPRSLGVRTEGPHVSKLHIRAHVTFTLGTVLTSLSCVLAAPGSSSRISRPRAFAWPSLLPPVFISQTSRCHSSPATRPLNSRSSPHVAPSPPDHLFNLLPPSTSRPTCPSLEYVFCKCWLNE